MFRICGRSSTRDADVSSSGGKRMSNCFCIQLSVRHSIHGLCGWPECRSGCVPERPIRLRVVVRGVNLKREKNCVIRKNSDRICGRVLSDNSHVMLVKMCPRPERCATKAPGEGSEGIRAANHVVGAASWPVPAVRRCRQFKDRDGLPSGEPARQDRPARSEIHH